MICPIRKLHIASVICVQVIQSDATERNMLVPGGDGSFRKIGFYWLLFAKAAFFHFV